MGAPEFAVGQAEVWIAWGPHLQKASEVGAALGDGALHRGLFWLRVVCVRIELNCRTPLLLRDRGQVPSLEYGQACNCFSQYHVVEVTLFTSKARS